MYLWLSIFLMNCNILVLNGINITVASFKNKTFCASHGCTGKCGRKMTSKERSQLRGLKAMHGKDYPVNYGYFCDEQQAIRDRACGVQGRDYEGSERVENPA